MKEGNYNMGYNEKLKIQFSIYFRKYAYIIISMLMFAFAEGMNNLTIGRNLSLNINNYYNQGNQVVLNIMIIFLFLRTNFICLYNETAGHFISLGLTRKRYYLGNVIAALITSLLMSVVCFITFFVIFKLESGTEHYEFIQYFGYKFLSFNVVTALQIIILTIAIHTFVCMLANLAGIWGMILTIKRKRIVPIIMTIIFGMILIWIIYYPTTVNYVFKKFIYINNSYALYLIVLIALSFLSHILGKNIFMKIDFKNR